MSDPNEQAWMSHPDLDGYEPTPVVRSQIPTLRAGGWYEVDAPPPPVLPDDEDTPAETTPASEHPDKPRRRKAPITSEDR